jgi:hypothetical protein
MIMKFGLGPGERLTQGQSIFSPDSEHRFECNYQEDGNLVLSDRRTTPATPWWSSRSQGKTCGRCEMRPDGNFVVADATGQLVFSSNTSGTAVSLILQQDGSLIVVSHDGELKALWASVWDGGYIGPGAHPGGDGGGTVAMCQWVYDPPNGWSFACEL